MLEIHPNIIEKNGKKEFAILPFDEFLKLQEELQDYEDLKTLREAKIKEKDIKGFSLSDFKNQLEIN